MVLGLYMVVFVLIAIVALSISRFVYLDIPDTILTYGLLAIVAFEGVRRLIKRDGEGSGGSYIQAVVTILTQKWLLRIVGIVIAIKIADGLLYWGMEHYFRSTESGRAAIQSLSEGVLGMKLRTYHLNSYDLASSLVQSLRPCVDNFFPNVGVSIKSGSTFAPLTLLIVLPSFARKLRSLTQKPGCPPETVLLRKLVLPAAVLAIVLVAIQPYWVWSSYALLGKTVHGSGIQQAIRMLLSAIVAFCAWILDWLFITPAMVAGLVGSLRRVNRCELVSWDTFVVDLVTFFKPLVGFCALLSVFAILIYLPGLVYMSQMMSSSVTSGVMANWQSFMLGMRGALWSIIGLLLMFCPYTLTSGATGVRDVQDGHA
jgi:hypothetical protein